TGEYAQSDQILHGAQPERSARRQVAAVIGVAQHRVEDCQSGTEESETDAQQQPKRPVEVGWCARDRQQSGADREEKRTRDHRDGGGEVFAGRCCWRWLAHILHPWGNLASAMVMMLPHQHCDLIKWIA